MGVRVTTAGYTSVLSLPLACLGLAGCCFGANPFTPPPPDPYVQPYVPPVTPTTVPTVPTAGTAQVTLPMGFAPDPMVVGVIAGGPVDANSRGPNCRGYLPMAPSVTINVPTGLPLVRLVGRADVDTTFVLQLANGAVVCDDDSGGSLNPGINTPLPAGTHQLWVGTYSQANQGNPSSVGFSTNTALTPQQLVAVPTTPIAAGPAIPQECAMVTAVYGSLGVGTAVTLGHHTPYTGPTAQGANASGDDVLNWNEGMTPFVGQRTTVTELVGVDQAGCPVVHVAADNGQYAWRVRNMTP